MILFVEPEAGWLVEFNMDLSSEQMTEMRELVGSRDVPADVALPALHAFVRVMTTATRRLLDGLALWLSMMAALGSGLRPARSRSA